MKPIAKGNHVYLRTISNEDFSFVYSIFTDFDEIYLWNNNRQDYDFTTFIADFKNKLKDIYRYFYIIGDKITSRKIGFIYCYNVHNGDGYAYTTTYLISEYRNLFYAAEAGLLYYTHLFRYHNYRKLYSEVYSYNKESIQFLSYAGFQLEGVLKQHRYYSKKYADLNIYAVYRDDFLERFEILLKHFSNGDVL